VGAALAGHLHGEGARLSVADVRPAATAEVAARTGATVVPAADAHTVPCDIFSPCALGAALKDPGERTNLFFAEADKRKELQDLLEDLKSSGRSAPKNRNPLGIERVYELSNLPLK
jgi:hypothetical protein